MSQPEGKPFPTTTRYSDERSHHPHLTPLPWRRGPWCHRTAGPGAQWRGDRGATGPQAQEPPATELGGPVSLPDSLSCPHSHLTRGPLVPALLDLLSLRGPFSGEELGGGQGTKGCLSGHRRNQGHMDPHVGSTLLSTTGADTISHGPHPWTRDGVKT